MSEVKFVLNLTIEGSSLQDIDDGLVKAAGQRLMARLDKPLNMSANTIVKGPEIKELRTPAMKERDAENSRRAQERNKKIREEKAAEDEKIQQQEEQSPIIKALHAVYLKEGRAGAEECLAKFGVKKCSELAADFYEPFVQYCNSKLETTEEKQDGSN